MRIGNRNTPGILRYLVLSRHTATACPPKYFRTHSQHFHSFTLPFAIIRHSPFAIIRHWRFALLANAISNHLEFKYLATGDAETFLIEMKTKYGYLQDLFPPLFYA
jgi:hypothetical protein